MFASILAALGMSADGVAEGLYAARHGFSARASGIGYAVGALVGWFYQVVTPVTFTVESITVATRTVQQRPQILYVVGLSAVPSILLGITGAYSTFIELLNPAVIGGIIAGVGVILAGVGVESIRERPATAGASTVAGFLAYLLTGDLVVVIVAAVVTGTIAHRLAPAGINETDATPEDNDDEIESIAVTRFSARDLIARPVLIGAISLFTLRLGAVVSYDNVNAEIAGAETTLDGVQLMAGAASLVSAFVGGAPLETTPAPMADAPRPVFATVLFMAIMAVLALLGVIGRVGRLVPLQSIAGFLVVLGIPVIMPENLPAVLEEPIPGATALVATALSNPFYGIVAGQLVAVAIDAGLGTGLNG